MTSYRAFTTKPAGLVLCALQGSWLLACVPLLLLAACGGEEQSPHLAPGTFAGKHVKELRYNCEQAIQCSVHNGDLSQDEIENDPRGRCLEMSAMMLNASAQDQQLSFLVRYNTCATLEHCAFVTCVQSQAMGFGEQQRASVEHYCNARLACDTLRGTFSGSAGEAFQFCVSHKIPELNGYTSDRQRAFAADFPMCSTLTSCDFFDCFAY